VHDGLLSRLHHNKELLVKHRFQAWEVVARIDKQVDLINPRRKGLVAHPRDWPYLGAIVPGYPFMHPLAEDFWPLFWKLYTTQRDPQRASPAKGRFRSFILGSLRFFLAGRLSEAT